MSSYYEKPKYTPSKQNPPTLGTTASTSIPTTKKLDFSTNFQNIQNYALTDAKQLPQPINSHLPPQQSYDSYNRSVTPKKGQISRKTSQKRIHRSKTPVNITRNNKKNNQITPQKSIPKRTVFMPPKPRTLQQPAYIASPLQPSPNRPQYSPIVGDYHFIAQAKPVQEKPKIVSPLRGQRNTMEKTRIELVGGSRWEQGTALKSQDMNKSAWRNLHPGGNDRRPIGGWQTLNKQRAVTPNHNMKNSVVNQRQNEKFNLNSFSSVSPFRRNHQSVKRFHQIPNQGVKGMRQPPSSKSVKKLPLNSTIIKQNPQKNQNNFMNKNSNRNIFKTLKHSNVEPPSIYQKYIQMGVQNQPQVRENVKVMTENIVQISDCMVEAHKCLNEPKFKQYSDKRQNEINKWNKKVKEVNIEFRKKISSLLEDLKYTVASGNGAEELFYELDVIASRLKSEPGDSYRKKKLGNNLEDQIFDLTKILNHGKNSTNDYNTAKRKLVKASQLLNKNVTPIKGRALNLNGMNDETNRSGYTIKRSPDRDVNFSQMKHQAIGQINRKIDFQQQEEKKNDKKSSLKNSTIHQNPVRSPSRSNAKSEEEIIKQKIMNIVTPNKRKRMAKPVSEFTPSDLRKREIQV